MNNTILLTNLGAALQAKINTGGGDLPLEITRITSGAGISENPVEQTAVLDERQEFAITSSKTDGNITNIDIVLTNTELNESYNMSQIGIYANDPDIGEILYRILQLDPPQIIRSPSISASTIAPTLSFVTGNASEVIISIDPARIATLEDLEKTEENANNYTDEAIKSLPTFEDLENFEKTDNRVSINENSTYEQYPNAKSVYDLVQTVAATIPAGGLKVPTEVDLESLLPPPETLEVGDYFFVQEMDVTSPGKTGRAWVNYENPDDSGSTLKFYKVFDQFFYPDGKTISFNAENQLEVKDNGITSAKIADSNVTSAKIASSAVTSTKIASSAVTSTKIGNSAVTETKIADEAITEAKIDINTKWYLGRYSGIYEIPTSYFSGKAVGSTFELPRSELPNVPEIPSAGVVAIAYKISVYDSAGNIGVLTNYITGTAKYVITVIATPGGGGGSSVPIWSTTEVITGRTWNGSVERMISIAGTVESITTNTVKTVSVLAGASNKLIDFSGLIIALPYKYSVGTTFYDGTAVKFSSWLHWNGGNIWLNILSNSGMSNIPYEITLYYV